MDRIAKRKSSFPLFLALLESWRSCRLFWIVGAAHAVPLSDDKAASSLGLLKIIAEETGGTFRQAKESDVNK